MLSPLRVMTVNLRFDTDRDGDNRWDNRAGLMVRVIEKYGPVILCTQEGKPGQLRYLDSNLSRLRIAAAGRHWDDECQYPTVYFDASRFTVADNGEFWLSETPEVHLSKSWDTAFPRMLSYVVLDDRTSGRRLWVAATHLDHVSAWARRQGAAMIRAWAGDIPGSIILGGDFNEPPAGVVHNLLTRPEGPFVDTWQQFGGRVDERGFTHHGFSGKPGRGRIDWILATPDLQVVGAAVVRDHDGGRYPSDHFPYYADLRWGENGAVAGVRAARPASDSIS